MKKRNVLTAVVSLALVAAVSVGGTLAYLSATTESVTNTFTTVTDGITARLDEAAVNPETGKKITGDGAKRQQENSYKNIVANAVLDKDPTVHVDAVPSTGADLYVLITGIDETAVVTDFGADGVKGGSDDTTAPLMTVDIDTSKWEKVANENGTTDNISASQNGYYKYKTEITAEDDYVVFEHVQIANAVEALPEITSSLTVKGFMMQNDNLATGTTTLATAIDTLSK